MEEELEPGCEREEVGTRTVRWVGGGGERDEVCRRVEVEGGMLKRGRKRGEVEAEVELKGEGRDRGQFLLLQSL